MRVLHTINSLHPRAGGPTRSVPGLACALARSGAEVFLWAANVPKNIQIPDGVQLCKDSIQNIMAKYEWDIVHDHGLWLPQNHIVAVLAKRYGLPRIVSPRGMLEPWALNYRKWKKRIAWLLYQKLDLKGAVALHATAESEARQLQLLGMELPVIIQPNGIELPQVIETRNSKADQRTALFLSRIHPKKGLLLLVEAWARIKPFGWKMKVIGPDEGCHLDQVRRLVYSAGLEDQWVFEPAIDEREKWQAFVEAELFLLPSYSENFGIVVAEALAMGLPVITTTGTPWSVLEVRKCGWWVKPEVGPLCRALREATNMDTDQLAAMGNRGIELVAEKYSWPKIGAGMLKAYEWILGGGSPPDCVRIDVQG